MTFILSQWQVIHFSCDMKVTIKMSLPSIDVLQTISHRREEKCVAVQSMVHEILMHFIEKYASGMSFFLDVHESLR